MFTPPQYLSHEYKSYCCTSYHLYRRQSLPPFLQNLFLTTAQPSARPRPPAAAPRPPTLLPRLPHGVLLGQCGRRAGVGDTLNVLDAQKKKTEKHSGERKSTNNRKNFTAGVLVFYSPPSHPPPKKTPHTHTIIQKLQESNTRRTKTLHSSENIIILPSAI